MIGHTMGASAVLGAISAIKALETSYIPPTINYETIDPDCELDFVPNTACAVDIKNAMTLSAGFGGQDSVLLFKKVSK